MHRVIRAWQKNWGVEKGRRSVISKNAARQVAPQLARAGIGDTFTRVPSASLLYEKTAKYCTVNVWNVMDGGFDRKPAKDDFKSLPPIDVGRLSPLFSGNLHTEL